MSEVDLIAELERLDRFLSGVEEGERPIDVLRARGIEIPADESLDDQMVYEKLWEIIEGLASIGVVLDSTDHLSDRELYRYLVADALVTPTLIPHNDASFVHISPVGGGSDADNEVYLRYYADDEIRADWQRTFGESLPPKERLPFDRDRLLPNPEDDRTAHRQPE